MNKAGLFAFGTLISLALTITGCAQSTIQPQPEDQAGIEGVLKFWISSLDAKKDEFDMELVFKNESPDKGIVILLSDIDCSRGDIKGTIKHTFFGIGEQTIGFKPQQLRRFNLICYLNSASKGDFGVTIQRVYENPNLDGKTLGKVLAKDIVWALPESKE